MPVTTKINVDQTGLPTDNGVMPLKDLIAKEDSPVVANLKHAGAIIVGRTNAPAFSMRIFTDNALHGRTLNPRDRSVTPGGSSGGAGASLAIGIGAHRARQRHRRLDPHPRLLQRRGRPAHRLRPHPLPQSDRSGTGRPIGAVLMAVQGPHTRTVRDARLALEVMARGDRRDWRWNDVPMQGPPPARPIKVAIVPEVPGGKTHPAQAAAVRQAGKHLQAAGYVVEEMLPPDIERGVELWHEICVTDVFGGLWPHDAEDGRSRRHRRHEGLARHPQAGRPARPMSPRSPNARPAVPLDDLLPAMAAGDPADALRPAAQAGRRHHQRRPGDGAGRRCAPPCSRPLLGLPGLAVPVGSHGKLRTGVQIMAMRNREDLCLDAGEVIEAAEGVVTPIDPA